MKSNEVEEIDRPRIIKNVATTRSELEPAILQSDVNQHCFYCNFTLECGQQICLWHDETARF